MISDTHIRYSFQGLPAAIFEAFRNVDRIIHCGDINVLDVLEELEMLAPVSAVCGNTDPYETVQKLPDQLILDMEGYRIGVTHGAGPGIARQNALRCFKGEQVDVLLYGHSHCPEQTMDQSIYCLNPGSATRPRCTRTGTVAVLTLGERVLSEIVALS